MSGPLGVGTIFGKFQKMDIPGEQDQLRSILITSEAHFVIVIFLMFSRPEHTSKKHETIDCNWRLLEDIEERGKGISHLYLPLYTAFPHAWMLTL